MSAAEVRPQIRAQSAQARGSLPAQSPGRGLLHVIYFSPVVSLFLVHVLKFLITSKELIWDSLSPCWRVSRGLAGQAGPCCAPGSRAGGCPGSPSNGGVFLLPTAIHKHPDTEERAGFSFALPTAKVPSVTPEPAFGSARPRPSLALTEQPQLWCFNPPTCSLGCWDGMAADGLMGFSPLQQQAPGWAGAMVHRLDTGAQRCKEVSSQKPKGVERSSTCVWDQGLCLGHCTA